PYFLIVIGASMWPSSLARFARPDSIGLFSAGQQWRVRKGSYDYRTRRPATRDPRITTGRKYGSKAGCLYSAMAAAPTIGQQCRAELALRATHDQPNHDALPLLPPAHSGAQGACRRSRSTVLVNLSLRTWWRSLRRQ